MRKILLALVTLTLATPALADNYAIVNTDTETVDNVIVWNGVARFDPPAGTSLVKVTGQAGPGWTYISGAFVPPDPPKAPVPSEVSRFQALAALTNAGLYVAAQTAVNGSSDPLIKLAWDNAQTFERSSPTIAALAAALGLTDAQVDDLFRAASLIKA